MVQDESEPRMRSDVMIDEILKALDAEKMWCREHQEQVTNDFYDGFIAGLAQAANLVKALRGA